MDLSTDPLARLDEVAWGTLHHAYGPAHDVPDQLRALRATDERIRHRALGQLLGNVYHQGTRWSASSQVVPFLVALADDRETLDRAGVVTLLRALVIGARRDDELPFNPRRAFAGGDGISEEQADLVARHLDAGDLFAQESLADVADLAPVRWAADAFHAGARHTDSYLRWLADPHSRLAGLAAELLAWFPPTERVVSALVAVPDDEARSAARASANLTLGHCPTEAVQIDTRLRDLLLAPGPAVRVTAAVALAYRNGELLPDRALDILVDARTTDPGVDPPGWDRSLRGFVALALQRLELA
ncbi:hypothetical protein ACFP2T_44910 [Plantactinospora solaniradicis]|uniref:HEAT repeat domain-containing protein n=1 Tax=Plantactinospora solaniradicis TaxID=1723736 RepID=A0ABW1KNA2_9ACTN